MDRSLLSGFVSIFGTRVLMTLVTVVSTPILYRLLGDSGLGTFATLMSIASLVGIFVTSGVTSGVRKFIAEDRDREGWERHVAGFYFRVALALALAGAVVLLALGYVLSRTNLVGGLFEGATAGLVLLYFALLAVMMVADQFRGYTRNAIRGFGWERYSEPLKVVQRLTFVGTAIGLLLLGYGVVGAVTGRILASVVVAVAGFVVIARKIPLRTVFRPTPEDFPRRQVVSFNSLNVGLVFFIMSLYHVDILMLQTFADSAVVGQYRAALTLAEFLWLVPLTIQALFVHSTSEMWSQDKTEQITDLAGQTTRYVLLVTAIMALGLAVLADEFVPFYFGEEFRPAALPLILLLPGTLGFAVARPTLAIQQGKGDLKYPIAATVGAAVLNVVLNALLIPRYGMAGAAVATSIGYGSMLVFHLFVARRYVGFDPLVGSRIHRILAALALTSVPLYLLAQAVAGAIAIPATSAEIPIALFVVPPVGGALYLGFTVLTGALKMDEVLGVLADLPDPVGSFARNALDALGRGGT